VKEITPGGEIPIVIGLGHGGKKAVKLVVGGKFPLVNKSFGRDGVGDVGGAEVNGNAAGEEAVEKFLREVIGFHAVFVSETEAILLQRGVFGGDGPAKGGKAGDSDAFERADSIEGEAQGKVDRGEAPGEEGAVPVGAKEIEVAGRIGFEPADGANAFGEKLARIMKHHEAVDHDGEFAFGKGKGGGRFSKFVRQMKQDALGWIAGHGVFFPGDDLVK